MQVCNSSSVCTPSLMKSRCSGFKVGRSRWWKRWRPFHQTAQYTGMYTPGSSHHFTSALHSCTYTPPLSHIQHSTNGEFVPVVVDRETLQAMHRTEVIVKKWGAPIGNQYYQSIIPDIGIAICRNCNQVSSRMYHDREVTYILFHAAFSLRWLWNANIGQRFLPILQTGSWFFLEKVLLLFLFCSVISPAFLVHFSPSSISFM